MSFTEHLFHGFVLEVLHVYIKNIWRIIDSQRSC